ncbi:hypothetical protein AAFC00_000958 [Neodothiora populina]|uniref:Meiotically up-regulated protein Msb1/Mug8 domain-containing protein n=1 Tax=Neodothiora populina TaxID=2781224 RepID=A0ABR3PMB1_9PEZI
MTFFSRVFKHKDASGAASKRHPQASPINGHAVVPVKPKFTATWTSKEVDPEEVRELIHACTLEMKSRAEALNSPFLLLPFRPGTDTSPARVFINNFYTGNHNGYSSYTGASLRKELVLTEAAVICSVLKWCWSRLPGGVVTWSTYEGFRMGEKDSLMARHAFDTLIPLSVDSPARKDIIYDFYDLLAAVAAHAKSNGLGGRKLSRMAGWWAFEHSDDGKGFDGGYKSWATAADASSHLFFAYLRSLEPESLDGFTGINALPRSLQSLLAQTDYPPETPSLLQRRTHKVVMLVEKVSPGPFALLRRAKHFDYKDEELQVFSDYDDPVQALTEECKRVLACIALANQSTAARSRSGMNLTLEGLTSKPDESWSRFQDFGFSDFSDTVQDEKPAPSREGLRTAPRSRANNKGRPTTPSWADFLNTGFADEDSTKPGAASLLLPPEKILPPLTGNTRKSTEGLGDENLEPGELASVTTFDLDDTFWWVWITSLATEEPAARKSVFGRCALIETGILGGRWLVMEEQVKGAVTVPEEGAYLVEKKSRFGFSRRTKANRRKSGVPQKAPEPPAATERAFSPAKASMSSDQQARIKNAAAALAQHSKDSDQDSQTQRRGRHDDAYSTKTNSIMTLGLTSEAGPAMKWARDFDRDVIRKQYLGDGFAGKGSGSEEALSQVAESVASPRSEAPTPLPVEVSDRELASVPKQEHQEQKSTAKPAKSEIPKLYESAKTVEPVTKPEKKIKPAKEPVEAPPVVPIAPVPAPQLEPTQPEPEPELTPAPEPAPEPAPAPIVAPAPAAPTSKIERKPVPTAPRLNNIHDHPAFRNKNMKPAEKAAKQAWSSDKPSSPEGLRKPNQGGFRKMFGMKKDKTPVIATGLNPPSDASLGRKMSLLRRKTPTGAPHSPTVAAPVSPAEPSIDDRSTDAPTLKAEDLLDSPVGDRHHWDEKHDSTEAERAFSQFDQGPIRDAPAFTPRESIDSIDAPDSMHSPVDIDHLDAPGAFPETPLEYPRPMEVSHYYDAGSENSMPINDRWAQIKKNAAERVTRMSEDQASSRPAQSILTGTTEDDGETSGEETIEARVARIKARVAELTGNLEPPSTTARY